MTKFVPANHQPRFFYGWVMVGGLALVAAVISGMAGPNFGLFVTPVGDELGLGRSFFGFSQSARMVGFALSGFVVGSLLDRHGPRAPLAVAAVLLAGVMLGLALMSSGWQLIVLFFLLGLIGMQGGGNSLYTSVPVASWFVRKRGRAMSLVMLGGPIGIAVSSPFSEFLIGRYDWRLAWVVLGFGGSGLILLIALFLMRRSPQVMGQLPDGATTDAIPIDSSERERRQVEPPDGQWDRRSAVRTKAFWSLSVAFGLQMFALTSIGVFRIPYFIERGIDSRAAAWALSAEALGGLVFAGTLTFMADRYSPRTLGFVGLILIECFVVLTIITSHAWQMFLGTFLVGGGIAMMNIVQGTIWPAYFGERSVGSIRGASMPVLLACSALGAPIAGITRDVTGTYMPAWAAGGIALVIAAAIIMMVPPPQRRDTRSMGERV
jgi:MFS family permease